MFPEYVVQCLDTLQKNGINAYLVGGCVRDLMLSKSPDDYDITTDAPPEKICDIFEKVIKTGIKHGTVTVIIQNHQIEITQMRTDGGYTDCRRPDFVLPCDDIKTDLARRDFTINAMAMDKDGLLVDIFDGREDLSRKIIRTVRNPRDRFQEDALRILRAFRFSAKLGFEIEENTLNAALELSKNLKFVSAERIFAELSKTLIADNCQKIAPLCDNSGLSPFMINCGDLSKLPTVANTLKARFALFLLLTNSQLSACEKLKVPNTLRKFAAFCFENINCSTADHTIKKVISQIGVDDAIDFFEVRAVFKNEPFDSERIKILSLDPCGIKDLEIGGNDLIALGAKGQEISQILEKLIDIVRFNKSQNTADNLKNTAKNMIQKGEF